MSSDNRPPRSIEGMVVPFSIMPPPQHVKIMKRAESKKAREAEIRKEKQVAKAKGVLAKRKRAKLLDEFRDFKIVR